MSQATVVLPVSGVVSGVTIATDINAAFDALRTSFTGASAPSADVAEEGQLWLDTSHVGGGDLPILRQYDGSGWIAIGVLETTSHTLLPNTGPLKTTGGTSTAYTLTTTPYEPVGTPTTGFRLRFLLNASNGGASTLAVNGGTAYPLRSRTGVDFSSNQLMINSVIEVTWIASEWLVVNVIQSGTVVATQADMETATSITTVVTPGRQKFHPAHPKAFYSASITPTPVPGNSASVNITTDILTWSTPHGLVTGDVICNTQNSAPQDINARAFYVTSTSATTLSLHTYLADAIANVNPFDWTSTAGSSTITCNKWVRTQEIYYGLSTVAPIGPDTDTSVGLQFNLTTLFSSTNCLILGRITNLQDAFSNSQPKWDLVGYDMIGSTASVVVLSGNFANIITPYGTSGSAGNWTDLNLDTFGVYVSIWGDIT